MEKFGALFPALDVTYHIKVRWPPLRCAMHNLPCVVDLSLEIRRRAFGFARVMVVDILSGGLFWLQVGQEDEVSTGSIVTLVVELDRKAVNSLEASADTEAKMLQRLEKGTSAEKEVTPEDKEAAALAYLQAKSSKKTKPTRKKKKSQANPGAGAASTAGDADAETEADAEDNDDADAKGSDDEDDEDGDVAPNAPAQEKKGATNDGDNSSDDEDDDENNERCAAAAARALFSYAPPFLSAHVLHC
jgi:hypothetical protein